MDEDRVASALERIADRFDADHRAATVLAMDLTARVEELEKLLETFVAIMENPQSPDQAWLDLLSQVQAALGLEESANV